MARDLRFELYLVSPWFDYFLFVGKVQVLFMALFKLASDANLFWQSLQPVNNFRLCNLRVPLITKSTSGLLFEDPLKRYDTFCTSDADKIKQETDKPDINSQRFHEQSQNYGSFASGNRWRILLCTWRCSLPKLSRPWSGYGKAWGYLTPQFEQTSVVFRSWLKLNIIKKFLRIGFLTQFYISFDKKFWNYNWNLKPVSRVITTFAITKQNNKQPRNYNGVKLFLPHLQRWLNHSLLAPVLGDEISCLAKYTLLLSNLPSILYLKNLFYDICSEIAESRSEHSCESLGGRRLEDDAERTTLISKNKACKSRKKKHLPSKVFFYFGKSKINHMSFHRGQ